MGRCLILVLVLAGCVSDPGLQVRRCQEAGETECGRYASTGNPVRDFFEQPVYGWKPWPSDPQPYATPCCKLPPPAVYRDDI